MFTGALVFFTNMLYVCFIATKEQNGQKGKEARKKMRRPDKWKVNVRHELYQSGKEYTNVRGKVVPAKEVKTKKDCIGSCKFRCAKKVGINDRTTLFNYYYSLS